ncbi:AmmeMemoRadiSam system radical SAM enzyme [Candidatus Micrarchaeota archaeon]|nr:AmmeMemoRadiSam system radical SAM enzyme [Candidatus Micrarchaeota archaeon]
MKAEPLVKKQEKYIECYACNHRCKIPEGRVGICGVRANKGGEFDLVVYGKPCAVWADPIEKKPLFHFLPGSSSFSIGTYGCNFSCKHCQNWDISQAPHDAKEKNPEKWREYFAGIVEKCSTRMPEDVVSAAERENCKSIAFTYNEPTIFTEYALDVMEIARKKGMKGVYVTNGYETKECWERLDGYIHAANIDLKAYTDEFYREICNGRLEPVKESIRIANGMGIWTEVTTLVIPGENDSDEELKQIAEFLCSVDPEMPWHVTAFTPAYKMMDKSRTSPETLVRAREIGKQAGLKYVYCGNLPFSYADYEKTSCPECGKPLVTRTGFAISENNIQDGKCRFCGKEISGVWE